jgi:hypothetical protein
MLQAHWQSQCLKFQIADYAGTAGRNLRRCWMIFETARGNESRNAYSLKPGFTETRLRPLARRRDKTFWPPWVFMRVRKPCFFDRLRRLGWNVRLGMKSYLLLIR